jgi:hypothetical protein
MKTPREILLKQHRTVEPKLDRMWNESLAPTVAAVYDRRESGQGREVGAHLSPLQLVGQTLWRELILPCRRIWAGLACAWVVIAVLNLASSESAPQVARNVSPPSSEEVRALIEQRQMLAQLIGPPPVPGDAQKRSSPGPRSERAAQSSAV